MAKDPVDWLGQWDIPFRWSRSSAKQITEKKKEIEDYARIELQRYNESHPRSKKHRIRKFVWHRGEAQADRSFYIVSAYLIPGATKRKIPGGGGNSVISPKPPPQP